MLISVKAKRDKRLKEPRGQSNAKGTPPSAPETFSQAQLDHWGLTEAWEKSLAISENVSRPLLRGYHFDQTQES